MTIELSMDFDSASREELFDLFLQDFPLFMANSGIELRVRKGESIKESGISFGEILDFSAPDYILIKWNTAATWNRDFSSVFWITFRSNPSTGKITVSISSDDWDSGIFSEGGHSLEWFTDQVAASFMSSISPKGFSNWLTDARARSPSGKTAREMYRNPMYHWPNFRLILHELDLRRDDYLLEVACGGGAFLKEALKSGCRAAAIDHSHEMIRTASEQNSDAIETNRLVIYFADAHKLPFEDSTFTAVVCTGAFGFFEFPDRFMSEVYRVLQNGGRFMLFTVSKETRGTLASPEPIGSMIHYYEDQELCNLAAGAGFPLSRVERPELGRYARESELPDDVVEFFSKSAQLGQLLYATK